MNLQFTPTAWNQYVDWQTFDKQTVRKINSLIKSILRDGLNQGEGQPEALRYTKAWSRRINHENRLVYRLDETGCLLILACKGHYDD